MRDAGLQSFSTALPQMHGLKELSLTFTNAFNAKTFAAFVDSLRQNTTVEVVDSPNCPKETLAAAQYYAELNRGGRKILASQGNVPPSLWPRILARSPNKPNVLYFSLQEKPDVLVSQHRAGTIARKRKREQMSTSSWWNDTLYFNLLYESNDRVYLYFFILVAILLRR